MTFSSNLAMQCYSVQPKDWIFVKGYGFLTFAKYMCRNVGKNISKTLNPLMMLKNLLQMLLKLPQKKQQKQLMI